MNYLGAGQAVEADPTYLPALKRLAWLNTQRRFDVNEYGAFDDDLLRKRDEQAEECYNKAVKAAPNDPEVLCAFGSFKCHIKSDKEEAQELFSRAVQLNPNSLEAHTCYALFLERFDSISRPCSPLPRSQPSPSLPLSSPSRFCSTQLSLSLPPSRPPALPPSRPLSL
jgi:tetratricopeptide (TPR) repeat protein